MTNYFKLTILISILAISSCKQSNGQINFENVDTSTYRNIPALVPYREGKLWGFSNADGRLIIPVKFYSAKILSDSLFAGFNVNGDNKTYVYNASAKLVGTYNQEVRFFQLGKNKAYPYANDKLFLFTKYEQNKVVDGNTYYSGNYKYYIYNKTGQFHFDSTGYMIEEFTSRKDVMAIGKSIKGEIKWGLMDTSGQLIEQMRYKKFYPLEYSGEYVKVKDSAGKIYAALSQSEQYHQWPKDVYDKVSEQIATGYFFIQYYSTNKQMLFKYTGDTICRGSKFDKYTGFDGKCFTVYKQINGKEMAGLIDSAGNELLPNKYDGFFGYRLMPWALIRTENDYTGLYDYSLRKILIDPSAGYKNIERVSNHWVSVTTEEWTKKIINPLTKESYVINSTENLVVIRDNGAYLYMAKKREILDLESGHHLTVHNQRSHGALVSNEENGKVGVFDLDIWKQVVPTVYDSISFVSVEDDLSRFKGANIVAMSKNGIDIYSTGGRKIFSGKRDIKLAASYRQNIIIEKEDGVTYVIDTIGKIITHIPKAKEYGYARTGFVLATYDDHSVVVNLSNGNVKKVKGEFRYLNHVGLLDNVPYISAISEGKTTLIDTRNWQQTVPYIFSAADFGVTYNVTANGQILTPGLFWVEFQYDRNMWRGKGYVNSKGFQYWKD